MVMEDVMELMEKVMMEGDLAMVLRQTDPGVAGILRTHLPQLLVTKPHHLPLPPPLLLGLLLHLPFLFPLILVQLLQRHGLK